MLIKPELPLFLKVLGIDILETGIGAAVVIITSSQAATLLEKTNLRNRKLSEKSWQKIQKALLNNEWKLNGETIVWDWNGVLQNGQHRLWACAESGVDMTTLIVWGVDPAAFPTYDIGKLRRAADVLGIKGHANGNSLAAAIRIAVIYDQGSNVLNTSSGNEGVSPTEVDAYLESHPEIEAWCVEANASQGKMKGNATILAAVLYLGSRSEKYKEKAHEFLDRFMSGENLVAGSPILSVRNRLLNQNTTTRRDKIGLIINAWNAYVEGRNLARMHAPNEAPKIKGADAR